MCVCVCVCVFCYVWLEIDIWAMGALYWFIYMCPAHVTDTDALWHFLASPEYANDTKKLGFVGDGAHTEQFLMSSSKQCPPEDEKHRTIYKQKEI